MESERRRDMEREQKVKREREREREQGWIYDTGEISHVDGGGGEKSELVRVNLH